MRYFIVWTASHRNTIMVLVAITLWIIPWTMYWWRDVKAYFHVRRAHRWGVDLATKSVTAGRKPVQ